MVRKVSVCLITLTLVLMLMFILLLFFVSSAMGTARIRKFSIPAMSLPLLNRLGLLSQTGHNVRIYLLATANSELFVLFHLGYNRNICSDMHRK